MIGTLFANANINDFAFKSGTALLLSSIISAGLLFSWRLYDRNLTLEVRDRLASNGRQRAIAVE